MIKIESLHIENFRGIKKLEINLAKKNFAVCGHNGSGKSGVVDAVDFAFTGNVSRLAGEGCGELSVKQHAPHVDHKTEPKKCFVRISFYDASASKIITVTRTLDNPKNFKITPDEPTARASFQKIVEHPEFVLSRREILQYILTEPGKRSKEVQALLKLDDVEKVRAGLNQAHNTAVREEKRAAAAVDSEKTFLLKALGISEMKKDLILEAVNKRRVLLGLEKLSDINKTTSVKDGILTAKASEEKGSKVIKKEALSNIQSLSAKASTDTPEVKKALDAIKKIYEGLEGQEGLLKNYRKQGFYNTGIDLIEGEICPFCDLPWKLAELKAHVQEKIKSGARVAGFQKRLQEVSKPLLAELKVILALMQAVSQYAKALSVTTPNFSFEAWEKDLKKIETKLLDYTDLEKVKGKLDDGWKQLPPKWEESLRLIQLALEKLPDVSNEDLAKDYLIVVQERIERFRQSRETHESWQKKLATTQKATATYTQVSESVLNGVYSSVEKDFAKYYQQINEEDESNFYAKLTPKEGALGLEVDFYKRGLFPPTAYHSEGHQDSMGVCLYLALMKKIRGNEFTFCVLDDVLMSVDSGHRKEVCKLLKTEFPNTQFILTTHDKVWFQQMISQGVISRSSGMHFRKWSVDSGPLVWEDKDIWKEIDAELEKDRVPTAAGDLRRYLEYMSLELARNLRAKIELCAVEDFDLGQLLPAVIARTFELLKRATKVATSWKQKEKIEELKKIETAFADAVKKTNLEQWAINKSVHYNEWVNLRAEEFKKVVVAFQDLLKTFHCVTCQSSICVVPVKGPIECLKCECVTVNFSLIEAPADTSLPDLVLVDKTVS